MNRNMMIALATSILLTVSVPAALAADVPTEQEPAAAGR